MSIIHIDEERLALIFDKVMKQCTLYGGDCGGPYFENEEETKTELNTVLQNIFSTYELRVDPKHFFVLVKKEVL